MQNQSFLTFIYRSTAILLAIICAGYFAQSLFQNAGSALFGIVLVATAAIICVGAFLGAYAKE